MNPTETFKYTMTDGDTVDNDPVAQSANLVIQVNGLNDAPVALDDAYDAYEVNDGAIVTLGNVGNASGGGDDYDPDTGETVPGTTPDAIVSFSPVGDLPAGVTCCRRRCPVRSGQPLTITSAWKKPWISPSSTLPMTAMPTPTLQRSPSR